MTSVHLQVFFPPMARTVLTGFVPINELTGMYQAEISGNPVSATALAFPPVYSFVPMKVSPCSVPSFPPPAQLLSSLFSGCSESALLAGLCLPCSDSEHDSCAAHTDPSGAASLLNQQGLALQAQLFLQFGKNSKQQIKKLHWVLFPFRRRSFLLLVIKVIFAAPFLKRCVGIQVTISKCNKYTKK